MMNKGQNGKNDWPMVPIFGRRKRPRQAFFAGPSQETSTTMSSPPNKLVPSYSSGYGHQKEPEDIDQFEFEKDDMDLLGVEMTPSSSAQRMDHKSKSNKENVSWSRKDTKHQHQPLLRKSTNIPLQSHPRNIKKQENSRKDVYSVEEKIEDFQHVEKPKQRTSDIKVEKKPSEPKSPARNRQPSVPRILTLTAYDIRELAGRKDKMMLALYEIYGILDSTATSTLGQCARRFSIRDGTGSLKCIFWEIDRPFPQLRRGASIRCVGRICNDMFQCLSIRIAIQSEMNDAKVRQKQSKDVIQKFLVTSREF